MSNVAVLETQTSTNQQMATEIDVQFSYVLPQALEVLYSADAGHVETLVEQPGVGRVWAQYRGYFMYRVGVRVAGQEKLGFYKDYQEQYDPDTRQHILVDTAPTQPDELLGCPGSLTDLLQTLQRLCQNEQLVRAA